MGSGRARSVKMLSRYGELRRQYQKEYDKSLGENEVLAQRKEVIRAESLKFSSKKGLSDILDTLPFKGIVNKEYAYIDVRTPMGKDINKKMARNMRQLFTKATELYEVFTTAFPAVSIIPEGIFVGGDDFEDNQNLYGYYDPSTKKIGISQYEVEGEDKEFPTTEYRSLNISNQGGYYIDTLTHELGHAIHHALSTYYPTSYDPVFRKNYEKYGETIDIIVTPEGRYIDIPLKVEAVSPYGNMNRLEAFSEAFTLYATGEEPKGVGEEYYTTFKSFMSDMGLEKYHGINRYADPVKYPLNSPNSTVKTTTLSKPEAKYTLNDFKYSIDGKEFTYAKSATAVKKGYFIKKMNGYKYTVDVNTGTILKKEKSKGV